MEAPSMVKHDLQATQVPAQIGFFAPGILLRVEGFMLFLLALFGYSYLSGPFWLPWLFFVLLLFTPDFSMLGYLAGTRIGAICYNLIHTTILPLALLATGFWLKNTLIMQAASIWLAHIGLDRVLTFGLKYPTVFQDTHLGRV
jgi:hypothetical protein